MHAPDPLPFRLRMPGSDTLDLRGARSISWRVEGRLYLAGDMLGLEWTGTRRAERVSLSGVKVHTEELPVEVLEIPVEWIIDARLRTPRLAPRLELRAGRLDAFDGLPGAEPGSVTLRLARRDAARALDMIDAIQRARAGLPEPGPSRWALPGNTPTPQP
jgi:hypothetical protein